MSQAKVQGENSARSLISAHNMVIALGGNLPSTLGPPAETVDAAIAELGHRGAKILAISVFYVTPAFPAGNGPDYVNAAVKIAAGWSPDKALAICHDIEKNLERVRERRWGQRTLDLDLIAYDDLVLPSVEAHAQWRALSLEAQMAQTPDELILPHPRLQDRAFVLVPMADVAPDWIHPVLGQSVIEMRDALDPALIEDVRPIMSGNNSL